MINNIIIYNIDLYIYYYYYYYNIVYIYLVLNKRKKFGEIKLQLYSLI